MLIRLILIVSILIPSVSWGQVTPWPFQVANLSDHNVDLKDSPVLVYFSPKGGCADAIVQAIGSAKKTLIVQAYSFTSAPIAEALKKAHDKGVDVQVILDKSQRSAKYTGATYLRNAGIPVSIDAVHAIAHNKVMVIDGEMVITGSFNFTKAAEDNNAENLLIIRNKDLAQKYTANWQAHRGHSEEN